jgi:hypothetical protein
MFSGLFFGFEELGQGGLVEVFSSQPDDLDLCCVVDVGEGIGAQ